MSTVQARFIFFFFFILHFLQFIPYVYSHSYPITKSGPQLQYPCRQSNHNSYLFCNASLPFKARAQSLISLLTLDEKIRQLCDNASAVPRLGIPPYQWWSESLHGIATNGPGVSFNGTITSATSFPQVIVAAAAFNRSLWAAVASAIAVEAKAMHNVGQAGLTFWAPNINIFRDPRWGRGQETPGEDPMVTSAYAVEYVRAFQGQNYRKNSYEFGLQRRALGDENDDDDDTLMLSACCKHFTAYDQVPFRSCILHGKASCLMCSYNSVNGIPACADHHLLQKAKTDWNFRGYITSDCDAVATIYEDHKYTKSPEDAVAAALKAGTDINCGTYMLRHMKSAVKQGKVLEEDIDKALLNLFTIRLRLGLFDARNRFAGLGPIDVCTSDHLKLALEAARQGIVLLKNEQKYLPFAEHGISSLAVIGPLADSTNLGGGYSGIPCKPRSIIDGLQEYVKNIHHAAGCEDVACNSTTYFSEALSVAKQAEHVILVVGLDSSQEREELDRYTLLLPGHQSALVTAVAAVSRKPLILVLVGGGPIDVSFAVGNQRIASILWIGYPGETGGKALSEIIFGRYNPGGRLPMTWYPESFTTVPMTDMNMRADPSRNYPGRTYRFYTGEQIFGFGYGLSYTRFKYKFLSAPEKLSLLESTWSRRRSMLDHRGNDGLDYVYVDEITYCSSLRFQVQISVMNDGDMDGSEVVLLFSKGPKVLKGSPEKQLIGFERINILSKGSAETRFVVDPCEHLSIADEHGNRILPVGDHILMSENIEHILAIEV